AAFEEKYDVAVEAIRLVTGDLTQRFAAEAEAGAPVADVIVSTHSPFFDEALANEWLVPLSEAGIPDHPGDFPEEDLENDGATAAHAPPRRRGRVPRWPPSSSPRTPRSSTRRSPTSGSCRCPRRGSPTARGTSPRSTSRTTAPPRSSAWCRPRSSTTLRRSTRRPTAGRCTPTRP